MKALIFILIVAFSVDLCASEKDSVQVEEWLEQASHLPKDSCRTLYFAKQMLNVPYVAGTLDKNLCEELIVHTDKVDCTTFVETVLALTLTDRENKRHFQAFKEALIRIRYRNGILNGYASRLHYFSDWIKNNQEKGIVKERCLKQSSKQTLHLNFMTTHPENYRQLKHCPCMLKEMKKHEQKWQGVEVSYLPKNKLNLSANELNIKNGDILAITTNINGLDVVHTGFACWVNGQLHLIHASSVAKKVILDTKSLYEYSKDKRTQTGVRAIFIP